MAFPGTFNFSYYKGDTYQFRIYPKDAAGNAFDLTPYANVSTGSVKFTISDKRDASRTLTVTASAIISDQSILCTIRPVDGNQLSGNTSYVYDVEIQDKSNVLYPYIYTVLTGTISVTEDVTKVGTAPLSAPQNLSVVATETSATVTWSQPASGDPYGYYTAYADASTPEFIAWYTPFVISQTDPTVEDFVIALQTGIFITDGVISVSRTKTFNNLTNANFPGKYVFVVTATTDTSPSLTPNIGPIAMISIEAGS